MSPSIEEREQLLIHNFFCAARKVVLEGVWGVMMGSAGRLTHRKKKRKHDPNKLIVTNVALAFGRAAQGNVKFVTSET